MASIAGGNAPLHPRAAAYRADQRFFVRFAIGLTIFILFAFAQFSLRGLSNPFTAPMWVHLHGGLMIAWLGLFVGQNMLAHYSDRGGRGMALHRQLGWASAALVAAIVVSGIYTGYRAVELSRLPPFFSDAHFLALTTFGPLGYATAVGLGIARRRQTEWHRRLMLGSTILLLEPAFGRLLPMPFMGFWGPFACTVLQLLTVLIIAQHDKRRRGRVHPATLVIGALVVLVYAIVTALSLFPPFVAFAASVAGGA